MLRKPRAYKDDNIRVGPKSKGISGLAKSNEPLVSHKELENLLTSLVTISFSIQAHLHGFSSSYIMLYSKKKKDTDQWRGCEFQKWWKICIDAGYCLLQCDAMTQACGVYQFWCLELKVQYFTVLVVKEWVSFAMSMRTRIHTATDHNVTIYTVTTVKASDLHSIV